MSTPYWDSRDDEETLEYLQGRFAARPTGKGVTHALTGQRLGLTSEEERVALMASFARLMRAGLVERVSDGGRDLFRLTEAGRTAEPASLRVPA